MVEGFTQKEMMVRFMDKLDSFDGKIDNVFKRINETHELASNTNGKVKLHTKLIWALGGTTGTFVTLFIKFIIEK